VLNVTPDSFYAGSRAPVVDAAVARALQMECDGADILDIGGESTRPGSEGTPAEEELARVLPVIEGLCGRLKIPISIDTQKAAVAEGAAAAGAEILNDVSALRSDPELAEVARRRRLPIILMHMRGDPTTMQLDPRYDDVVAEVAAYLAARVEALCAAGLARETLAVDPGIGFGKTVEHNLCLLARLDALKAPGRPVVVGVSRKSFLGKLTGRDVAEREAASLAAMVYAALRGAHVVRVHDVRAARDAAAVVAALRATEEGACPH